jgi:hypothetical protein
VHDLFPDLWARAGAQEVRLHGLTRSAAERLVRAVLPGAPGEVVARIVARAEGNAFHLEELIRHIAERGAGALPETLLTLAEARLSRLDPEGRRFLRVASVFGESFRDAGVAALIGEEAASHVAPRLVAGELIVPGGEAGEHRFRHGLLRDAAYAMLTADDRADLHRRAGAWLEQRADARDALRIADHFELAGERERALDVVAHASDTSSYLTLHDAAELLARGRRLGASQGTLARLVDRELLRRAWQRTTDRMEHTVQLAVEALSLNPPGSIAWIRGAAMVLLAGQHAPPALAQEVLRQFLSVPLPDHEIVGLAVNASLMGLVGTKERDGARALLARAQVAGFRHPNARGWVLVAGNWLDFCVDGDLGAALAAMEQAEALFRQGDDIVGVVNAIYVRAWVHLDAAAYDVALATALEVTRMSAAVGGRLYLLDHAQLVAASAELCTGDLRGAAARVSPLVRSEDAGVRQRAQHLEAALALAEGRLDDAERLATTVRHAQYPYALVGLVGARAAVRRGDLALALERAEKTVETATRGATPPGLLADAELELTLRLVAVGQTDRAREVAARADARVQRTAGGLPEARRARYLARHAELGRLAREL